MLIFNVNICRYFLLYFLYLLILLMFHSEGENSVPIRFFFLLFPLITGWVFISLPLDNWGSLQPTMKYFHLSAKYFKANFKEIFFRKAKYFCVAPDRELSWWEDVRLVSAPLPFWGHRGLYWDRPSAENNFFKYSKYSNILTLTCWMRPEWQ